MGKRKTITIRRYAIRLWDPAWLDRGTWWHCQGLPAEPTFEFAILYGSRTAAEKAIKSWKFQQAVSAGRLAAEVVPVDCTFEPSLSDSCR